MAEITPKEIFNALRIVKDILLTKIIITICKSKKSLGISCESERLFLIPL